MAIPESISRFAIREQIGRGGFAVVYRAFDPERGEEVALKVYPDEQADPEALAFEKRGVALQQELGRKARQVAEIYAWGDGDGRFWVAMELVRGTDLAEILKREGRLAEERALAIAVQLCEVLDIAHHLPTATGVGTRATGSAADGSASHPTVPQRSAALSLRPADPPPASSAAPAPQRPRRRAGVLLGVLALGALAAFSEGRAAWQGRILRQDLGGSAPDVEALWERYRSAERWSLLDLGLGSARAELRAGLLSAAEATLTAYREADLPDDRWREAQRLLQKADALESDDRVHARRLYVEAQLERLDIPQRIPEDSMRKQPFAAVAARFEEAARLDAEWPDPYLGLVALYSSPLLDLERLRSAVSALERRGLAPGPREREMLAHACQREGAQAAARAYGTRREAQQLLAARDLLQDALRLYSDLPRSPRVEERRQQAKYDLDHVARRLRSLRGS